MAKREQQKKQLTCPDCGLKGALIWSENEKPVYASGINHEHITSLSDGFVVGNARGRDALWEIKCGTCGTVVA